ncbi:MAG: (2Fe-2S)-binding protein [Thermosipho sp. (in: Bacteria)]|nr:(2Fe-2S)-binding protein [Thermosipho sp. (in: thermotogales)]
MKIKFTLNGTLIEKDVPVNKRAIDFLRDDLGILSIKEGCGEGECGACTILVNGKNVHSCLMLAVELDGKEVITVEGLKDNVIQEAYVEAGAIQCGFCTPGFIISTKALLNETLNPTPEEIKEALEGNLCRCTGYVKIEKAVKLAAKMYKGSDSND